MQINTALSKGIQVIGVMSGTSLDGLDICACTFWQDEDSTWRYEIIAAETVAYDHAQKKKLAKARQLDGLSLINLDLKFGAFIGRSVNKFIHRHNLKPALISSHGHTIFHQPSYHLTYQIGNGNSINIKTGIEVVCDFRTADVLNGGQGAPLVPQGDVLLFGEYTHCLNLGGIANICDLTGETPLAFDTSPCNMALNELANEAGYEFDRDGLLASKGALIEDLLLDLNALPYYSAPSPKSLGIEWYESEFKPLLEKNKYEINDMIYTVTHHIAYQIRQQITAPNSKVLVTGGGAKNNKLLSELNTAGTAQFLVPDEVLVDYKEALIFALLGVLKKAGSTNTLASVTGATENLAAGSIYHNYKA